MNRRRYLTALAVLAATLLLLGSLAPRPDQAPKPAGAPSTVASSETIDAQLPRDGLVRARVGDLVELAVTSARPEGVEFPALGELEAAAPGAPARFSFYADRTGRFPVLVGEEGKEAGAVEVRR